MKRPLFLHSQSVNPAEAYVLVLVIWLQWASTCAGPQHARAGLLALKGDRPYMGTSSFASTPFFGGEVRLLTYIRRGGSKATFALAATAIR